MVNFSLENKIALITGASYGIGFAIATAYAEAGAKITCRLVPNQEPEEIVALLKAHIDKHKPAGVDVT